MPAPAETTRSRTRLDELASLNEARLLPLSGRSVQALSRRLRRVPGLRLTPGSIFNERELRAGVKYAAEQEEMLVRRLTGYSWLAADCADPSYDQRLVVTCQARNPTKVGHSFPGSVARTEVTEDYAVGIGNDQALELGAQTNEVSRLAVDQEDAVLHPLAERLQGHGDSVATRIITDVVGDQVAADGLTHRSSIDR